MVGNLHFTEFEKFIIQAEKEYEEWEKNVRDTQTQELFKHINQILKQIDAL